MPSSSAPSARRSASPRPPQLRPGWTLSSSPRGFASQLRFGPAAGVISKLPPHRTGRGVAIIRSGRPQVQVSPGDVVEVAASTRRRATKSASSRAVSPKDAKDGGECGGLAVRPRERQMCSGSSTAIRAGEIRVFTKNVRKGMRRTKGQQTRLASASPKSAVSGAASRPRR